MTDFNQTLTLWLIGYFAGRGLSIDQAREVVVLKRAQNKHGDMSLNVTKAAKLLGLDANLLAQQIEKDLPSWCNREHTRLLSVETVGATPTEGAN